MARKYRPPPAYVQTLQEGPNATTGSLDQRGNYRRAVQNYYNADNSALITQDGLAGRRGGIAYDPQHAATYAKAEQQRYQGGPGVSANALGQAAYDQNQYNALQNVGAQRGSGGQAQGLRAAMVGANQSAAQQQQAQTQARQEQVAQRQAILDQRLAMESQQQQAELERQKEKDSFNKQRSENDADTMSGMAKVIGTFSGLGLSDERTKVKTSKRRAPKLVIMLGGH
jgi:hypothetical protein